ncbi:unnamed protein product [Mycena citricolor]|uniref:Uncharacterized protein n=1 Tax=Mycena citricolor TaxID=2018698 RepID=A0AAD2H3G5_9AGAR|nr:unnamed protein product [Mycena citricolor]
MGCRKLDSAKTIAVRLVKRGKHTRREIADICGFSTRTLTRALGQYQCTRNTNTVPHPGRCGRQPLLHKNDVDYLIHISQYQPGKFLDEYQDLLARASVTAPSTSPPSTMHSVVQE